MHLVSKNIVASVFIKKKKKKKGAWSFNDSLVATYSECQQIKMSQEVA